MSPMQFLCRIAEHISEDMSVSLKAKKLTTISITRFFTENPVHCFSNLGNSLTVKAQNQLKGSISFRFGMPLTDQVSQ